MNTHTKTKFVGIKEFRQNIAQLVKTAQSKKERIIVMNRNKPLFEIKPFAEDEYLDSLVADVAAAREDIAAGRVYTEEEILKEFNIA
jgi:PHD/YefM family antitoxin component YafN of YafNO toxin-antitoxin module